MQQLYNHLRSDNAIDTYLLEILHMFIVQKQVGPSELFQLISLFNDAIREHLLHVIAEVCPNMQQQIQDSVMIIDGGGYDSSSSDSNDSSSDSDIHPDDIRLLGFVTDDESESDYDEPEDEIGDLIQYSHHTSHAC